MTTPLDQTPLDSTALVNAASPIINTLGAAFYFHPDTVTTAKANGLDGFRLYVLGRGGVLGDAPPLVVSSAFGWWNPATIEKLWTSAKATMTPQAAASLYLGCAHDLGRSKLSTVEGLAEWNALAEKVVAATDFAGLPLSAGYAAVERPADAPGQAMHLLALLREHRGDVHLNAVLSRGPPLALPMQLNGRTCSNPSVGATTYLEPPTRSVPNLTQPRQPQTRSLSKRSAC
jgi:hypothetical protein